MLANITAALTGRRTAAAAAGSMIVQMELAQLKSSPILNPHFGMVIKYLDCLNRLMDALVMSMGPSGVTPWLVEVQTLIRLLQKRIFQRMPLTPAERQALLSFATYWRQMVQPPSMSKGPIFEISASSNKGIKDGLSLTLGPTKVFYGPS